MWVFLSNCLIDNPPTFLRMLIGTTIVKKVNRQKVKSAINYISSKSQDLPFLLAYTLFLHTYLVLSHLLWS